MAGHLGADLASIDSDGRYLASSRNAAAAYRRFYREAQTNRVLETALHYELAGWVLGLMSILGFISWLVL